MEVWPALCWNYTHRGCTYNECENPYTSVRVCVCVCVCFCHKVETSRAFQPRSLNGEKQRISFVMSVRPSVHLLCLFRPAWDNSSPLCRIWLKFNIWRFVGKSVNISRFLLKSEKNKAELTWRPMWIYNLISLNFPCSEKYCKRIFENIKTYILC